MSNSQKEIIKYHRAFNFVVSFNGGGLNIQNMGWQEVSGIGVELDIEEFAEGGQNQFAWRLPKPPKYKNLVLKRASSATHKELIDWANNAFKNFAFAPTTVVVSITSENDKATPIRTWNFVDAYPVKMQITDLSAQKNELIIETLELAYKYFEVL